MEEENIGCVVVKYVSRNRLGDRAVVRGKVPSISKRPYCIHLKSN
jgi:hypothetical protein